ncbi:MAG: hypothetical protein AAFQ41_13175 [Cyanobacteria bacterium J06623_7]
MIIFNLIKIRDGLAIARKIAEIGKILSLSKGDLNQDYHQAQLEFTLEINVI